jgi:hypothetical protein
MNLEKLRRSKKAQGVMEAVKEWAFYGVVTIILLVFFAVVFRFILKSDVTDVNVCKLSVMGKFGGSTIEFSESNIALQCRTRKAIIKSDGIYEVDEDRKEVPALRFDSISTKNPYPITGRAIIDLPASGGAVSETQFREGIGRVQAVEAYIVDKMYDCWDQFYEGKLNFYGAGFLKYWSRERCVVCSEISFEPDWIKPEYAHIPVDITSYVSENRLHRVTEESLDKPPLYSKYFGGDFRDERGLPLRINTHGKTVIMFKAVEAARLSAVTGAVGACLGIPLSLGGLTGGAASAAGGRVVASTAASATQAASEAAAAMAFSKGLGSVAVQYGDDAVAAAAGRYLAEAAGKAQLAAAGITTARQLSRVVGPASCAVGLAISYYTGELSGVDYKAVLVVGPSEISLRQCDKLY